MKGERRGGTVARGLGFGLPSRTQPHFHISVPKPHFHPSNSFRNIICVVLSEGSLVWSQTDTEKPLKSIIAVENSLLEENLISLGIPSSWLRSRTLWWWVFACPQKKILSRFSLIWASVALKHFILWWVWLRGSWYFSLIGDVWDLLHSCEIWNWFFGALWVILTAEESLPC